MGWIAAILIALVALFFTTEGKAVKDIIVNWIKSKISKK